MLSYKSESLTTQSTNVLETNLVSEIKISSQQEINRSVLGAWSRIRRTQANEWRDGEGFVDVGIWGNSNE